MIIKVASQWRSEPRLINGSQRKTSENSEPGIWRDVTVRRLLRPKEISSDRDQNGKWGSRNEITFRKVPATTTYSARRALSTISSPSYVTISRVPSDDATSVRRRDAGVTVGLRATQTTIAQASPKTNTVFAKAIRPTVLDDADIRRRELRVRRGPAMDGLNHGRRLDLVSASLPQHATFRPRVRETAKIEHVHAGIRLAKTVPHPALSKPPSYSGAPTGKGSDPAAEPSRFAQFLSARNAPMAAKAPAERATGSTPAENSGPTVAESSSVTGELWLDTISLREWLHSYLTGELTRSSLGSGVAGGTFAGE
jgi:hypothetical protein